MKKITKILSLLLAVAMVLSLNLGVLNVHADDNYTITINNTTSGYTYAAYQIFSGTLSGSTLSDIVWGNGVDSSSLLSALHTASDETGNTLYGLFPSDCDTAAEVADVLADYGNDSAVAQAFADIVSNCLSDSNYVESTGSGPYTISISQSNPGYYFIKNTVVPENGSYTRYILEVVKDVTTTLKQDIPSVEKKVYEESYSGTDDGYGYGYNDVADYDIGDAVPFKLIGTLPDNLDDYKTYQYIFHDKLDDGLTFDSTSVKVYVDSAEVNSSCYEVVSNAPTDPSDGCTFEVRFTDIKSVYTTTTGDITVSSTSKVIVEYKATLNDKAVIGYSGNKNEVYLEYSNNPNWDGTGTEDTGKTPKDYNIVFTYELDATKIDGETSTALSGAKFVLYKTSDNTVNGTPTYVIVDANGKVTGWTENAYDSGESVKASVLESAASTGLFIVSGLDEGTYFLEEIEAPSGYNKLTSPTTLVITASTNNGQSWTYSDDESAKTALTSLTLNVDNEGASETTDTNKGKVSTNVENNSGAVLPSTGGMGTKIFYTLGGLLVVCAGVLLIVKRRMRNA